jgi:peptide/nickel transport system substrate-binding protein
MKLPRRRPRRFAVVALLALLSMLATACGSADSGGGKKTSSAAAELSTAPLRVVLAAEPSTFNPVLTLYSTLRIVGPMFDPLVGIDKKTLEPNDSGLLTKWERVSPTEWRFTVRDGVKFQNGEPWDAAAAAFTIEKYRDEPKSGFAPYYKRVVSATAESPTSLLVTTNGPYIAMPLVLTTAMGVPPKHYAEVGGEGFSASPVGTGPFAFGSVQSGQSLSLVANKDYWQGAPKLGGITYTWAADAATRGALLQSGGADVVADLPSELLDQIDKAPDTSVLNAPSLYKMALTMNGLAGTLSDVKLREAVQSAIDYDALVKTLFGGVGARPSSYFTGDVLPNAPKLDYHKFDLNHARALVKAAGGSPTLRFLYTTGFYPKDKQVGEAVSAMLEAAGFTVEQVPLDNTELRKERNTGNYSLYMVQIFPVFAHPDSFFGFFTGSAAAVKYCPDAAGYDALQAQALTATDEAASYKVYSQLEKKILDQDRCNAILYDQVVSYGLSDKVQGFKPALDAVPDLYKVSLLK